MGQMITYGRGGFDPTKPNNNVVAVSEIPDELDVPSDPVADLLDLLEAKKVITRADRATLTGPKVNRT